MRKILILFLFLFLATPVFAADTKVVDETAISAVAGEDLVYCVDDPGGTPLDRKCTFTQAQTFILTGEAATATALAANGGNCATGEYPLGVDASGAVESCTDATTEIDSIIASDFPAIIAENGAEEMLGETMGTACSEDQILKANATGGLNCAADDSGLPAATQADQETGTSNTVAATPGRQQYHASAAKAWAYFLVLTGTVTPQASYNVASITDTGVGDYLVNFTTNFSVAQYAGVFSIFATANRYIYDGGTKTTSASQIRVTDDTLTNADVDRVYAVFYGDQ